MRMNRSNLDNGTLDESRYRHCSNQYYLTIQIRTLKRKTVLLELYLGLQATCELWYLSRTSDDNKI